MLATGTLLQGRYEIRGLLGQGGMGTVYLAEDNRLGHLPVAVKEMDATQVAPAHRQATIDAFRGEAQMLARLNHPGIARVMDYFSQGDYSYLVMEYVAGETLDTVIGRAPRGFDQRQALVWAGQLAVVLDYLHQQNPPIIFRDLKPGNVMLEPGGTLKLIDFGIARHFKPGKSQDTLLLGTPGYAAPEQYGRGQTDARTDVYGLGVVVHQLLTGHDPALTPMHLPPLRQLRPDLSPQLEAAVAQATQNAPTQRFASTMALARALGAPVSAPLHAQQLADTERPPVVAGVRGPTDDDERPPAVFPGWVKGLIAGFVVLVLLLLGWFVLRPLLAGNGSTAEATATQAVAFVTQVVTPTPDASVLVALETPAAASTVLPEKTATMEAPTTEVDNLQATIDFLEAQGTIEALVAQQTATAEFFLIQATSRAASATLAVATVAPAATAAPVACSRAPLGSFGNLWSRDRLGCATNNGNGSVWMAMQTFDGGVMFWREDTDKIYALYNGGGWARFDDVWVEGDPTFSCGTAESPPTPLRGFGRIWCDHNSVRDGLGNARDAEWGAAGTTQDFERGTIVTAPNGHTYVLYSDNGTWR